LYSGELFGPKGYRRESQRYRGFILNRKAVAPREPHLVERRSNITVQARQLYQSVGLKLSNVPYRIR
jgi:hypothetical protein